MVGLYTKGNHYCSPDTEQQHEGVRDVELHVKQKTVHNPPKCNNVSALMLQSHRQQTKQTKPMLAATEHWTLSEEAE